MIVYNGSLELYINNKAFLFFFFFPETISSRLSVRLSEKQGLPASFGSGVCRPRHARCTAPVDYTKKELHSSSLPRLPKYKYAPETRKL